MSKSRPFMRMSVTIPHAHELKQGLGVDEQGDVQRFVTREIFKRLKPYLPKKEGHLRETGEIVGNTLIKYTTPYARAQFFGVTSEGKPFKYMPTGAHVGPHWDRRMVADEGASIIEDAQRYVRSHYR